MAWIPEAPPPKDLILRMLDTVDRVDDKVLLVLVGS
jgi:hypothetical protein